MTLLRLERPAHYGNNGVAFDEKVTPDDPYIFPPENTRDLWSTCHTIAERYGYDFRSDPEGNFVLRTRNNPHRVLDIETTDIGGTESTHPSAFAGTYIRTTGSGTFRVAAARIDLVCPRAPGLGVIAYSVTDVATSTVVAGGTIQASDPDAPATGIHFYDYRSTTDGSNATVATLYSGWYQEYDVTVSAQSGTIWVDCLQLWHTDPTHPLLPGALKTEQNALSVATRSSADQLRNLAIVVGRRRAVVTDSDKLDTNPNNPSSEFVVAAAVNKHGITDPTDPTFIGFPKESIIYDSGITDQDFAEYLARVFIYRYRNPRPSAPVEHTFLPAIDLRDPVFVEENTYQTLPASTVLWVTSVTHRIQADRATTQLDTTSFTEFPSYELREDIDVDQKFFGQPMINVDVQYTSLTGHAKTKVASGKAYESTAAADVVETAEMAAADAVSMAGYAWPPVPGTMFVKAQTPTTTTAQVTELALVPAYLVPTNGELGTVYLPDAVVPLGTVTVTVMSLIPSKDTQQSQSYVISPDKTTSPYFWYQYSPDESRLTIYRGDSTVPTVGNYSARIEWTQVQGQLGKGWLGNTPYHRLTEVDYAGQRVLLPWEQGDGSAAYQRNFTTCKFRYRALRGVAVSFFSDPYGGNSPFYDPYTSELGHLVAVTFDTLLSGLYRITVRSRFDDTVVAYLTEPTADPTAPEAHWTYFNAAAGQVLFWDGIDQIGTWNQRQSAVYADAARGVFEIENPLVGAGFYAWNREERVQGELPLALISGDLVGGKPVFGQGTWGEWYVSFECRSDRLQELFEANPNQFGYDPVTGRTVDTGSNRTAFFHNRLNQTGDPNDWYEALVYTHLPEVTRCAISVADWKPAGSAPPYTVEKSLISSNWQATPDAAASINNRKPVRFRFAVQPRPGVLWAGQENEVSVKLTRHVHLRRNLMDQLIKFEGVNYPGQPVESRKVVNRRLTNDDHTLTFVDERYRKADTFKQTDGEQGTEWIFQPKDFKKDFRGVPNTELAFADYLQLEEVPFWDTQRAVATTRSRLQIAFIQDLFYFSAHVQDRSGRFSWCLNTAFVDKSKRCQNTAAVTWPDEDSQQHFRRTIVCRQWTDEYVTRNGTEQSYPDYMAATWGDTPTIRALSQRYWRNYAPGRVGSLGGFPDDYTAFHATNGSLPGSYLAAANAQLGHGTGTSLGSWTWESDPSFPPSVTRDFHGFYLLPPMVDKQPTSVTGLDYRNQFIYVQVDSRGYREGGDYRNSGDDVAALAVWESPIDDDTATYGSDLKRFRPSFTVVPDSKPTLVVHSNTLDYLRQDQLVHYEELRGIYSRGPRPAEAPKKVASVGPYYQNVYTYAGVSVGRARDQKGTYPLFKAEVTDWFDFKFRDQYVWESARFFPTDTWGRERLDAVNADRAGVVPRNQLATVRYDAGAWVGFKDDGISGSVIAVGPSSTDTEDVQKGHIAGRREFTGPANIFTTGYLPWAVGPMLPQTRFAIFHLVLVPERRSS